MTRRRILFRDTELECCWITPEFNGDKTELLQFGSADSCDKDWAEIYEEFRNVKTLPEFEKMNAQAQKYYHSSIAKNITIFPIENISDGKYTESDLVIEEIIS
jgi:hypothetical protein